MAIRLYKNLLQNKGVPRHYLVLLPSAIIQRHHPAPSPLSSIAVAHYCSLLLLPTDPRYGPLAMVMSDGDG